MYKLKANGLKFVKGLHLIAVSCWIGGGLALVLLYFLKSGVTDGGVLYGINLSTHHVDRGVVVIPGAFGCLITGLIFSLFSNWGFLKHKWIILKWILTIAAIYFGGAFLGPWERGMMNISGELGLSSFSSGEYLRNEKMHLIFSGLQLLVLVFVIYISIYKPWRSKKSE